MTLSLEALLSDFFSSCCETWMRSRGPGVPKTTAAPVGWSLATRILERAPAALGGFPASSFPDNRDACGCAHPDERPAQKAGLGAHQTRIWIVSAQDASCWRSCVILPTLSSLTCTQGRRMPIVWKSSAASVGEAYQSIPTVSSHKIVIVRSLTTWLMLLRFTQHSSFSLLTPHVCVFFSFNPRLKVRLSSWLNICNQNLKG